MNENQVFNKLIAFLGNKSEGIISSAQITMKSTYGIVDGATKVHIRWQQRVAQSAFFQTLFAGLIACIFISAWRIVSMIVNGESFYFLALAFATVIAETINESMMVFMSAYSHEHAEKPQEKDGLSWSKFFHYFSLMGVFRLISRLLFGRELPILQYLLVYLILVGVAFNLDYELGLTGAAEKGFHILYAMLPIVGIGILSHYLGVNLREEKAKVARQNVDFDSLWSEHKLEYVLNTLQAKAANGVGYCAQALAYYETLVSGGLDSSAISSGANGSFEQTSGFGALAYQNGVKTMGAAGNLERSQTFRTSDIDAAKQVLDAYPDKPLDDRGWHPIITAVTGISRGTGSTRIYEAMHYVKSQDNQS